MEINYGNGKTEYGPGVQINLDGNEVAIAIDAWLVSQGVIVRGPRTIRVNGEMIENGGIYIDPSGFVVNDGKRLSGRGPTK
ncbi:MAG: hypothetical protein KAJ19_24000 [Gammaproteobacteria bacterium]|nr:hypothetical protein [Gammaproteobacteria bacterium]